MTTPSYILHAAASIVAAGSALYLVFTAPEHAVIPTGVAALTAISLLERDRERVAADGHRAGYRQGTYDSAVTGIKVAKEGKEPRA